MEMALAVKKFCLRAVRCSIALYLPDRRVSNAIRAPAATAMASLPDLIDNVQKYYRSTGIRCLSIEGHLFQTRETSLNFR